MIAGSKVLYHNLVCIVAESKLDSSKMKMKQTIIVAFLLCWLWWSLEYITTLLPRLVKIVKGSVISLIYSSLWQNIEMYMYIWAVHAKCRQIGDFSSSKLCLLTQNYLNSLTFTSLNRRYHFCLYSPT